MRRNTATIGLLLTALFLVAAATPAEAAVFVKMPGLEGESEFHEDGASNGGYQGALEAGDDSADGAASGADWEFDWGIQPIPPTSPDAFFEVDIGVYDPATGASGFDVFFDVDVASDGAGVSAGGEEDPRDPQEPVADETVDTPAGPVRAKLTYVALDLGYFF